MINQNVNRTFRTKFGAGILTFFCMSAFATQQSLSNIENVLSFDMAIKSAQKDDPWLTGNIHKQKALESMSTAKKS
ncbi:MAG: hypothetical protein QNK36_20095 [Colwellia sp.]|nr:hypothetical protein [Colwellia sp.]